MKPFATAKRRRKKTFQSPMTQRSTNAPTHQVEDTHSWDDIGHPWSGGSPVKVTQVKDRDVSERRVCPNEGHETTTTCAVPESCLKSQVSCGHQDLSTDDGTSSASGPHKVQPPRRTAPNPFRVCPAELSLSEVRV